MSNTRTAYTDLVVGFTLGTSTDPSTTTAADMITDLYKQCYLAIYGNMDLYHATDDNIDSKIYDAMNAVVKRASQRIVRKISDYYRVGSNTEYPVYELTKDEVFELQCSYGIDIYIPSHEDEDQETVGDNR